MGVFSPIPKESALQHSNGFDDPFRSNQDRKEIKRHGLEVGLDEDKAACNIERAEHPVRYMKFHLSKRIFPRRVLEG